MDERGKDAKFTVWIYFNQKGPDIHEGLKEARKSLNPRALERRLRARRYNSLVDEHDVPVYDPYVEKIKPFISRIRHRSRWLNAVSVEVKGYALWKITPFLFVKRVDVVRSSIFRDPVITRKPKEKLSPPFIQAHVFDYGTSFSQVNQIQVPALHDFGLSGKDVLICMLDAGFNNLSHEALDHLDIIATWDFVNNDPLVIDQEGQMGNGDHGTYTLGAIAGFQPGELIGPAYGASFLLGKTENTDWERHVEEDHWIAGAEWADQLGADIISSSLGYRDRFTDGEANYTWEDMDGRTTVVARGANIAVSRGILIVNSAGNEGASFPPQNTLVSPSDSARVLAAGAVNTTGERVEFSSTGPTADGRIKPDVMAQGMEVYSANPDAIDEYGLVDGTSFSCPLVAGVAALILEANPTWTNEDIMYSLKVTASSGQSPDNRKGWGVVDAFKAAFYNVKIISPPKNFAVKRIENNYGFFIQYVDLLSWSIDPRNQNQVDIYRIYWRRLDVQDEEFILFAEVDNQTFNLTRRGLLENEKFLYKITSVSETGEESDPDYASIE